jgi:ribosomal protein S12 methylthiotransferase
MKVQEGISFEKNQALIGQVMPVLIDRIEDGVAYGRTEFDTPEVDNEVIIQGASEGFKVSDLKVGEFYQVEMIDAEAFDLFGEIRR